MPVLAGFVGPEVDVAVIGAGAAGLGAARHLARQRPDLKLVVVEAADRLGGRAHTTAGPLPLDLGCGWLHGAQDNAWTALADTLGFTVDRTPAPWNRLMRDHGLAAQHREAALAALNGFFERIEAHPVPPPDDDPPLSAFLEPDNPWNGFVGAVGTYINGVELEAASTLDYDRYEPGRPPDWRVRDGYGRLIAAYGAEAPVVLSTPVTRIAHGATAGVALDTPRGTLRCRAAVVTVSSSCLAAEGLRFDPPLPGKVEAAAGVPLGVANKLFLDVADPGDLPVEAYLHGRPGQVATGSYHIRPFGRPVIECYYGGRCARDIEGADAADAFAFAADELAQQFGTGFTRRLSLRARSAWAANPWTRGSYSYARPGCADARAVLAEPVGNRLFFAGEACSRHRFSTAHGAYETGVDAAEAVAAALN